MSESDRTAVWNRATILVSAELKMYLFPFRNSVSRNRMPSLAPEFSFFSISRPSITARDQKFISVEQFVQTYIDWSFLAVSTFMCKRSIWDYFSLHMRCQTGEVSILNHSKCSHLKRTSVKTVSQLKILAHKIRRLPFRCQVSMPRLPLFFTNEFPFPCHFQFLEWIRIV